MGEAEAHGAGQDGAADVLERAVILAGTQGPMVGVFAEPRGSAHAAVLMVAGQPQTRVGSHRMFVDLARGLAVRGIASLRFDCGGWGDSPGDPLPFEQSDGDIAAAAAALSKMMHSRRPVWLWGLCDGASAAVLALPVLREAGIEPDALVLVNPWVRSEASLGEAMVRTYYARRLFQREFWGRLLTGKVSLGNLVVEPARHLTARFRRKSRSAAASPAGPGGISGGADATTVPREVSDGADTVVAAAATTAQVTAPAPAMVHDLPAAMLAELECFRGRVLTVLSGNDLTAGETESLMKRSRAWRRRLQRSGTILRVPGADHTFSQPEHWATVMDWMAQVAARR
jgi:exosortase A-associated hydrolase 1